MSYVRKAGLATGPCGFVATFHPGLNVPIYDPLSAPENRH